MMEQLERHQADHRAIGGERADRMYGDPQRCRAPIRTEAAATPAGSRPVYGGRGAAQAYSPRQPAASRP